LHYNPVTFFLSS